MLVLLRHRIFGALILLLVVFLVGTTGFKLIGGESWSLLDSVYMTAITLSTVGYGEVRDLSSRPGARIFAMALIIFGMFSLLYITSTVTAFIVEGDLKNIFWSKQMSKYIDKMKGHFIVCGGGETGLHIAQELIKTKRPFVIIEPHTEALDHLKHLYPDLPHIQDDPTDDEVLVRAGIVRARGLIAVMNSDKDNLFITITARRLNPALRIIAEGIEAKSSAKLRTAGADSVVLPNTIGALRLVSELVRPTVVSFLDLMLRDRSQTLRVEETTVAAGAELAGKTLVEAALPQRTGQLVLAVKRRDEETFHYNPPADTVMGEGDTLIVMGGTEGLEKLKALASNT